MEKQNINSEDNREMTEDMIVEGYDDCGSSSKDYECKQDCIIIGGPLISKIH